MCVKNSGLTDVINDLFNELWHQDRGSGNIMSTHIKVVENFSKGRNQLRKVIFVRLSFNMEDKIDVKEVIEDIQELLLEKMLWKTLLRIIQQPTLQKWDVNKAIRQLLFEIYLFSTH